MIFVDEMTLAEARDELRELVDEGHRCPLCTQFAKVYRRKIHSTMARELIALYRHAGRDWVQLTDALDRWGGDTAKLRYWQLLEEDDVVREDGSTRAGWWRVTELGERFVLVQTRVAKYARIYDGRCLGLIGEPVSIVDCLGQRFDYRELMA